MKFLFFLIVGFFSVSLASWAATTLPITYPSLLIAEKNKNAVDHVVHNRIDWTYNLDGPLKDIQAEPDGSFLVTGGKGQVSLVKRDWKSFKTLWDWDSIDLGQVVSAAAADWDSKGHPTLIVAADVKNSRLFVAEAHAKSIQIKWQYKLPSPPKMVRICPDTGNFLVLLRDGTVHEVFFQEDKEVWSFGPAEGFKAILDVARGPWAHTYIADAQKGSITCLDPRRKTLWETHLPFAPSAPESVSLSLWRKNGKRLLLAAVHFSGGGSQGGNVLYLLNTETGKVLQWHDRLEKGFYPAFFKVIPAQPSYYQKQ